MTVFVEATIVFARFSEQVFTDLQKSKLEHSGDEVGQGSSASQCLRSAGSREKPSQLYAMIGVFWGVILASSRQ
jgi:hypothetical protein